MDMCPSRLDHNKEGKALLIKSINSFIQKDKRNAKLFLIEAIKILNEYYTPETIIYFYKQLLRGV